MKKLIIRQSGQAMITLIFIAVIGITITFAATIFVYQNLVATSLTEQGSYAYYIAESGVEEGILRLLRNPSYVGTPVGQPLIIGSGNAVVVVSGNIITSTGTYNNSVRKIQAQTVYNNGVLTIQSWKEIE